MKKLLILLLVALLAYSCNTETKGETHVETTQVIRCEDGVKIYVRKFTFENHQYIEFCRPSPGYDNYTGFVHDPNCWCMIDYD
jgi:hypothetical protein